MSTETELIRWQSALLSVGKRMILALIMYLGLSRISRRMWKKGYDRNSSLIISAVIVYLVCLFGMCLIWDMRDWIDRKANQEQMADYMVIEGAPITAQMLGLRAAEKDIIQTESDSDGSYVSYTVLLDGGGYLDYGYSCYYDSVWPQKLWERYEGYAEKEITQTDGMGDGQEYEAFEVNTDILEADQVGAVMRLNTETGLNKYTYYIQKDKFFLHIDYVAPEPFSDVQLKVIADSMQ